MKKYRVYEFSRKLKEAFDYADDGKDVVIYRNDKVYILKVPNVPELYKEKFFEKG